jgi:hypothetical protein
MNNRRLASLAVQLAVPLLAVAALLYLAWLAPCFHQSLSGRSSAECATMRAQVVAGTLPSKVVDDPRSQCVGIAPAGVIVGAR